MNELRLIHMSDIEAQAVEWLWYPYIPLGKITIVQGDPGEGKTMLILTLAALLTKGRLLPEERTARPPANVIYQTAEDGLADTVKPRLEKANADCSRVMVIDESSNILSFSDSRIEEAIVKTQAKLFVLDPLQAYLGAEVDMHRANEVRPAFRRLADVAERTQCAIVIIGHLNKMSGIKGIYRGLGSIDIPAIARSILFVGRSKENNDVRCMAQLKNSLAPTGKTLMFEIANSLTFTGACDLSADKLMQGGSENEYKPTKAANAIEQLERMLCEGGMPANEIYEYFDGLGISEKTVKNAKKELGVISQKQGSAWVWSLPNEGSR